MRVIYVDPENDWWVSLLYGDHVQAVCEDLLMGVFLLSYMVTNITLVFYFWEAKSVLRSLPKQLCPFPRPLLSMVLLESWNDDIDINYSYTMLFFALTHCVSACVCDRERENVT